MRLLPHTERRPVPPPVAHDPEPSQVGGDPSILLTHDGWVVGHVVDVTGRVADALVGREAIGVMTSEGYREFERDDILALVPPATPSRNELRIAKRELPVTVDLGGLVTVTGNCHLLPGATVWDVWQRSASGFAALTDARVRFPDGSVEAADVVLVSRHAAATGLQRD